MAEKRPGEGTVAAGAVERNFAGLGGVDDHHAGGGLDAGEPAPDIERPADLREIGGKRVVAAGIEEDEAGRGVPHHVLQHEVELDGFEIEVGFGFELRIDRREEVPLVDLQTVAGIIEEADIGAAQRLGEGPDALLHVALAEVDAFDHLEAERLQLGGDVGGVVARIGEARNVLIGRVADDERHALVRRRRRDAGEQGREGEQAGGEMLEHGGLHELGKAVAG